MPGMIRRLIAAGAVICVLAAGAACGGDERDAPASAGGNDETPNATAPAPSKTEAPKPATDEPTSAPPSPTPEPPEETSEAGEVKKLARKFVESTFRAEYRMSGGPDLPEGGTLVLYKRGEANLRFDITSVQDGEQVTIVFITTESEKGVCLAKPGALAQIVGAGADQGVCFASDPSGGGGVAGLAEQLKAFEEKQIEVLEKTERTIAGRDARCYKVKEGDAITTVCLDNDGTLLYVADESGTVVEATGVTDDVADDVFKLPYPLQELPRSGVRP